ncbi:hypothetical protein Bca52824_028636 [Brassica carinata]|uniref:F-box domain-containing protein n=1 Tax=Brassica carinata TaxID=52824 RepID=A0A8X8AQD3_BRACI|nr:hypothetical protein Bca52824_028636 [Brassica carinata]
MYLVPDLLEEIFLGLPLRSVVKFRTVSKQWKSILESRRFEAYDECSNEDENHGRRRPPKPNPAVVQRGRRDSVLFDVFPGYWRMGFGRDNVSGSYKIVRMGFNHHWEIHRCEILDVNIGRWQKLSPPPYEIGYRRKSTCVNGSIYWVEVLPDQKLLALDLHAQEWRDVGLPLGAFEKSFQVANLENRLALAATFIENDHWNVKIWSAEAPEETWSVIYSIRLFPLDHPYDDPSSPLWFWTRPVAVSKKRNLFFQDSYKRLFKCYPETGEVRFIAAEICVISPFVENLVPLGRLDSKTYRLKHLDHVPLSSRISNFFRRMELKRSSILVTTAVVTLVMFRYCSRLSRS